MLQAVCRVMENKELCGIFVLQTGQILKIM